MFEFPTLFQNHLSITQKYFKRNWKGKYIVKIQEVMKK